MRTAAIAFVVFLTSAAAFAADQSSAGASPKLAAMLEAKDANGKPIVSPEDQAYFNGLNDNLRALLNDLVQKEVITRPEHLATLLGLQLRPQKMEVLLQNRCILCHTDSESQSAENLFSVATGSHQPAAHMNLKEIVEDTHFRRGLSCAGCHGGDPTADFGHDFVKEWPDKDRQKNRGWVVQFCARCHSDPTIMHEFNPSLPTDQLAKFKDSPHGRTLLEQHDDRAPSCVSCHGVHGIRPAKDPQSKVYAQRVPETCGACHADPKIMAGFTLAGRLTAPDESTRGISGQRPWPRAARARRPRRARLQHVPRQPRRQPTRRRAGEPKLQPLSLGQCQSVRRQQTQAGIRSTQLARMRQVPWQSRHCENA